MRDELKEEEIIKNNGIRICEKKNEDRKCL